MASARRDEPDYSPQAASSARSFAQGEFRKIGDAVAAPLRDCGWTFQSLEERVAYNLPSHQGCDEGFLCTSPKGMVVLWLDNYTVAIICCGAEFDAQDADFLDDYVLGKNSTADFILKNLLQSNSLALTLTAYVRAVDSRYNWTELIQQSIETYSVIVDEIRANQRNEAVLRFLSKSGFRNIKVVFSDFSSSRESGPHRNVPAEPDFSEQRRQRETGPRGEASQASTHHRSSESQPTAHLVIALVDYDEMIPSTRTFPIKFSDTPWCMIVEILFSNSNAVVTLDLRLLLKAVELADMLNEVLIGQMYRVDTNKKQVYLAQRIYSSRNKPFEEVLAATYNEIIVQYQWTSQAFYYLITSPEKSAKECLKEIEHRNPSALTNPVKTYSYSSLPEFQENLSWFRRAKEVMPAAIPTGVQDFHRAELTVNVRKPQSALPLVSQLVAETDGVVLWSMAEECTKVLKSQNLFASYDLMFIDSNTPSISIFPVAPVPRSAAEAAARSFHAVHSGTTKAGGKTPERAVYLQLQLPGTHQLQGY